MALFFSSCSSVHGAAAYGASNIRECPLCLSECTLDQVGYTGLILSEGNSDRRKDHVRLSLPVKARLLESEKILLSEEMQLIPSK